MFAEECLLDQPFERPKIPPFEEILYTDSANNLGGTLRQIATRYCSSTGTIPIEPTELYCHLSKLLLLVQHNAPKSAGRLGVVKNSTKQELVQRLQLAKEVMNAHEAETLNIDAIAQQCALSGSHFFRSFKKHYGVSPYQYMLQGKIKQAAALLQVRDQPITDVALQCGFADLASFSKAFKKLKGVSPKVFLMQCRK
jgi:AraC-like DNA-binding protein